MSMGHDTHDARRAYLPAAGRDVLLPFYDPLVTLLGGDSTRTTLMDQAALEPGHRVLDIGCGTGSLLILLKRSHPAVEVVGMDPDPKALARARRKAERARLAVRLDRGFSEQLPYPEASFDRVFSSFMLHHVRNGGKEPTLREVRRVLRRGGSLHLVDLHAGHGRGGAAEEGTLALMRQAGFETATCVDRAALLFGHLPISYYRAS